ncbi:hypothetical protein ESY86_17655 [Subsaximicrobium wynnwilliamsii]|uniref:Uncharacterized protein n=1 Tax=Subsaximicrobium wynnwilliamsii TaxID=291179 RepID=A0A5C6ZCP9_9FLAO|nr:hypothetical protein [Subsaximicrobium wynnwilliamsii]TXD82058.1 hypothetical protein ESY87_15820 [Subsaximicrobium wynnwilliamsii]TXD87260.1 hypothetical protein ESY86_17655 [Subsaximicrobium wynnwilliamsii]TXE01518.1 hypothetical protein ESY88_15810 [Subsaximicrobium wynnwilliamsii]
MSKPSPKPPTKSAETESSETKVLKNQNFQESTLCCWKTPTKAFAFKSKLSFSGCVLRLSEAECSESQCPPLLVFSTNSYPNVHSVSLAFNETRRARNFRNQSAKKS